MDDKDMKEFSRENFKEKILREMRESQEAYAKSLKEYEALEEAEAKAAETVVNDTINQPMDDQEIIESIEELEELENNPIIDTSHEDAARAKALESHNELLDKDDKDPAENPNFERPLNTSREESARIRALATHNEGKKLEKKEPIVEDSSYEIPLTVEDSQEDFNKDRKSRRAESASYAGRSQRRTSEKRKPKKASNDIEQEKVALTSEPENNDEEVKQEMPNNKRSNKKKQKSAARKIITTITLLLVLLIAAAGFFGYRYVDSSLKPLDASSTEFKSVEIPVGSSNKDIGNILEKDGIIKSGSVFQYYTKFKSYAGFQSGYYNFSPNMNLDEISQSLQEGGTDQPQEPVLGKVVIPEGYTLEQIAETVTVNAANKKNDKTPFTKEDFLNVVKDDKFIADMKTKYPELMASLPDKSQVKYQLEGYLFPATYDYTHDTDVKGLVEKMIAAMNTTLTPYYQPIANKNLSVNEVLSLAALVEKEGANDEDRKNIAQVFYNRLAVDMPLQSNIAILYAEGKVGKKTTLKEDATIDTKIDSPYNLYVHTGYGPGPVANPGEAAIKAVVNPKENDYLYFVADVTTGKVYYSKTIEEHDAYVSKYINDQLED